MAGEGLEHAELERSELEFGLAVGDAALEEVEGEVAVLDAVARLGGVRDATEDGADARDEFWAAAANRTGRVRPLVAASVGPYGAFLADGSEYRGDYGLSVAELMAWHRPRMAVLAAAGADLFALETIPCLAEVEALAALLAEFPHMPAWLACSCRDGAALSSGEPIAEAARIAEETSQVVAMGVNCTAPRYVEELLAAARRGTTKPLLCYPNSGEAWDATARCWVEGSGVTDFAEPARRWVAAGARLVGGCCRTTPEDIAVIAQVLRAAGQR